MCGIAGAFSLAGRAPAVDRRVIARLNDLQRHRGPDGEGLWCSTDGRVALGHRRLAIIDTSASGAQPMSDATGRWTVTFNGEIYNYRALRRELEQLGCVFLTNSDTEVLINVVARWGEPGLRRLRGMYAFALWDAAERELWLVRDPYGIKPLYVAERDGVLWFASQARALAKAAPLDTAPEAAALAGFYLWGHVPEPFTWWTGIRSLPAGHVLRAKAGASAPPSHAFAKVEEAYVAHPPRPLDASELRALVADSVRHHLVADVPVGVFLSAGVDSNVIAAVAAEMNQKLQTITVKFDEYAGSDEDEAPIAEAAARLLGTEHTTLRIGYAEFEVLFESFLSSMDQPTIDALNTYVVSHAASQLGLKVALSGLGGDELFGGYPGFGQIPKLARWGRRLSPLQPLGKWIERAIRAVPLSAVPPKVAGLLSHSNDLTHSYLLRRALYLEDELEMVLDETWMVQGLERLATDAALARTVAPLRAAGASDYAQVAALESCWYLRNQLLRDADWSSMAHSLEVRVPFVDFTLLEAVGPAIASSAPPQKRDLAACSERIIDRVKNRKKTGFTTPVRQWLLDAGVTADRGLRGWATQVHSRFRTEAATPHARSAARIAA
jgi:asparagine synthase (glutamine-hydrolysing)